VWDVETGAPVFVTPEAPCGHAVGLDPTGSRLAVQTSIEGEPNVQIWELSSGEMLSAVLHDPAFLGAAAFDPDGARLLTAGGSGTARIWDAASGERLLSLEGHTGPVESAIWSADGTRIVTASADATVRLWDAANGETLLTLGGHDGSPAIALSPDGRYLATTAGRVTRVWALQIDDLIQIAESRLTRVLSTAECVTYHFEECPR
jgi:WD40 repeat protein